MGVVNEHIETLTSKEVAHLLGVSHITLCIWRGKNVGPPYIRRVGRVFYTRADIDEWMRRLRVPTG